VATDVLNPQSPYNFLLLAMHQGAEKRNFIEQSTACLFNFINSIIDLGGIDVDFGFGSVFINIKVLFVSDLKMLPLVFGVNHSSSSTFWPICLVKRKEHHEGPCIGEKRNLTEDKQANIPLLHIPVENFVCPPLHLIQGLTNKIFEVMDKKR
jgi:hypothetical protein